MASAFISVNSVPHSFDQVGDEVFSKFVVLDARDYVVDVRGFDRDEDVCLLGGERRFRGWPSLSPGGFVGGHGRCSRTDLNEESQQERPAPLGTLLFLRPSTLSCHPTLSHTAHNSGRRRVSPTPHVPSAPSIKKDPNLIADAIPGPLYLPLYCNVKHLCCRLIHRCHYVCRVLSSVALASRRCNTGIKDDGSIQYRVR